MRFLVHICAIILGYVGAIGLIGSVLVLLRCWVHYVVQVSSQGVFAPDIHTKWKILFRRALWALLFFCVYEIIFAAILHLTSEP